MGLDSGFTRPCLRLWLRLQKCNPWKRPPPAWRRPSRGLRAWKWTPREDSNPNLGRFKAGLNALREDVKWSAVQESNLLRVTRQIYSLLFAIERTADKGGASATCTQRRLPGGPRPQAIGLDAVERWFRRDSNPHHLASEASTYANSATKP